MNRILLPLEVNEDHGKRYMPDRTRLSEAFSIDHYQRSIAVYLTAVIPVIGNAIYFRPLRRLADLGAQDEPPQQYFYLYPPCCPIPKLGPSARGPPLA
jgi:hypothetical protein